jgi:hypothetical protein
MNHELKVNTENCNAFRRNYVGISLKTTGKERVP